jgi:hypothetical protein
MLLTILLLMAHVHIAVSTACTSSNAEEWNSSWSCVLHINRNSLRIYHFQTFLLLLVQRHSVTSLAWFFISFKKQQIFVSHRYRILQETESTRQSLNIPHVSMLYFNENMTSIFFFVDTTFWQKVCLQPNCLLMRESQFNIYCVGYDKFPFNGKAILLQAWTGP